ncbi:unnamed protein product [Clavelina lepadiformis]|uniref:Uncharacterized protein n=1 Tax=Clavelina lepadiformis TaxID=159417 RepID=A0ABP0FNR2_CLALP
MTSSKANCSVAQEKLPDGAYFSNENTLDEEERERLVKEFETYLQLGGDRVSALVSRKTGTERPSLRDLVASFEANLSTERGDVNDTLNSETSSADDDDVGLYDVCQLQVKVKSLQQQLVDKESKIYELEMQKNCFTPDQQQIIDGAYQKVLKERDDCRFERDEKQKEVERLVEKNRKLESEMKKLQLENETLRSHVLVRQSASCIRSQDQ